MFFSHNAILLRTRAVIILLTGMLVTFGGCSSGRGALSPLTIKVMTFNIAHGQGADGRVDIRRIARVIQDARPDIVALQEVDRWTERTGKLDLITELADRTGMTYAFGKTIDFDAGDYGNGFLTRFPIIEERNFLFSQNSGGEQRGMMLLVLDIKGEEIVVINTHLDHRPNDTDRVAAAEELVRRWEPYKNYPTILCADLNDDPSSRTLSILATAFEETWQHGGGATYPSTQPTQKKDYVLLSKYASTRGWRAISARVIPTDASNYLPILVELQLSSAVH